MPGSPYSFYVAHSSDTWQRPKRSHWNIDADAPVTARFAQEPIARQLPAHDARHCPTPTRIHVSGEDARLRYARANERVHAAAAGRADARARRATHARNQRAQSSVRSFRKD